jgi:hypothetical protein
MDRSIRLMTIEDAAGQLGLEVETVKGFVLDGLLTASTIDGRYLLSEMQLMFFKRSHARLLEDEYQLAAG